MNKSGALIISLDFELVWGVFDVIDYRGKIQYFENTRAVIPEILKEFKNKKIHATWATVGMLFNQSWEEWEENIPGALPEYNNKELSAYRFGKKNRSKNTENICFAPELIRSILKFSGQEIGTHTYSHYYCLEPGQNSMAFRQDLIKSIEMAEKYGIELKSLVFPRNQLEDEYLKICMERGISNVRSNPDSWYWKDARSEALLTKVARTGDAYFPLGRKSYSKLTMKRKNGLPLEQKASRFYRPVETNKLMRKLKLKRVVDEMEIAAKEGEFYHLWWHPHNFGQNPVQSLKDLKYILEKYEILNKKYGFQSMNMMELSATVSQ